MSISKHAGRSELLNSLMLKVQRGTLSEKEGKLYRNLVCNESMSEEEARETLRKMEKLGWISLSKK